MQAAIFIGTYILVQLKYPSKQENYIKSSPSPLWQGPKTCASSLPIRADLATPIDLTHSYLRATSLVHFKYLGNRGVRLTMSVSLDYWDKLWGLICCHPYGPTSTKIPFLV